MRRREFIALAGGAAASAWPLAARAQGVPAIGYLTALSPGDRPHHLQAFRDGLGEVGYREGRNVTIEYRFADGRVDRLRSMAADLIARQVTVIAATGGNNSGLIAKELTSTIPIVFTSGFDPVKAGLVASLNRPEANVTGVSWFAAEMGPKHIELLREIAPSTALVGLFLNPANPESAAFELNVREAAPSLGVQILVMQAETPSEVDAGFARLVEQRVDAVLIGSDPFFTSRAHQIGELAFRHRLSLISTVRETAIAGGLISYGNSVADAYRRAGVYTGRVLKGAKPAELPVDRATKFDLAINMKAAKMLGLEVPPKLLFTADEVFE
jgi:putative ABC transport system substrate-binding protein